MREFRREGHERVMKILLALDADFLATNKCYFGGGTRVVLELDEYRESMDMDFVCADMQGYRALRSTISDKSLGAIMARDLPLRRDVRADMYGIRTFIEVDDTPIKFEIISEGRIDLSGEFIKRLPVAVLDRPSCVAEKLLANTDRGRDKSTNARDVIDLAYMAASWREEDFEKGLHTARLAYGETVDRELAATLAMLTDQRWRSQCIDRLSLTNTQHLTHGLKALERLLP